MHPLQHFVVTGIAALAFYVIGVANLNSASLMIAGGVLIDIDHIVEFFRPGFWDLVKPSTFFNPSRFKRNAALEHPYYLLIFHTFEFITLLFVASMLFTGYSFLAWIAFGMSIHVFTDIIYGKFVARKGFPHQAVTKRFFLTLHLINKSLRTDSFINWKSLDRKGIEERRGK
ncbi:MAG TPA: hypothetical protein VJI75_02375 [Candidatus Nanoarchaeia archaeon]|nr:hypothetical protein [Candidatus Nanoarchaeia archaeon]